MGKYGLIRRLASGGMAEVFLAKTEWALGFEKTVVVKRIHHHLREDPQFLQMFLNEAKLSAQLNHPNIAQIFDFGEADGEYFLAMEYIDGPNLRALAKAAHKVGKPISFAFCAKILSYACEGLAYAHDYANPETGQPLNIVHRDLSPENIVIAKNGAVKVVDFGIAKTAAQLFHTQSGLRKGKLAYMSPEYLKGDQPDRRSDVFALGVVLYELISNKKPYDAETEITLMHAMIYESMVSLRARKADVPEDLERIVNKALARDPGERYQDCRELLVDLERYVVSDGGPLSAVHVANLVASLQQNSDATSPAVTPGRKKLGTGPESSPPSQKSLSGEARDISAHEHTLPHSAPPAEPGDGPVLAPGAVINQYELIRELGSGGMGSVFLARDTRLGRRVAIKFLHTTDAGTKQRFILEARTTASCSHENIVIVHEVAEHDSVPFMVLEYLPGKTLKALVAGQRMPAARAVELMIPVVRALAHAHGQNIVHRDLKPDNIIVTASGTIKVLDFGIAKVFQSADLRLVAGRDKPNAVRARGAENNTAELTQEGAILGTLPYMAPEQWSGSELDPRVDLWAVGIMLFQMLAGRHPLAPLQGLQLVVTKDLGTAMPRLREAAPDVAPELASVVDRCLRKRREERFPDALALLRALELFLPRQVDGVERFDEIPYAGFSSSQETDGTRFFDPTRELSEPVLSSGHSLPPSRVSLLPTARAQPPGEGLAQYDVFLSYASEDRAWCERLAERLRDAGVRVWVDFWELQPGDHLEARLNEGLERSRKLIAVFSKSYFAQDKHWTIAESYSKQHADALARERSLIPVLTEDCTIKPTLSSLLYVDFRPPADFDDRLRQLIQALNVPSGVLPAGPASISTSPVPHLTEALAAARKQLERCVLDGQPTEHIKAQILELRRQLRAGGQLHPRDVLGDRYYLAEQIGRGGFGTVWKAYDRFRSGLVAVKVLHGEKAQDASQLERFFRGAARMAELSHPAIMRIIEARREEDSFHYYVMEYLDGGDLRAAVRAHRITSAHVIPLICEIGAGLQHAHDAGLVHRDVKPGNIVLDRAGRAKLTDFDLVRAIDSTGGTRTGMLGTFVYAAPECLDQAKAAGPAADIYSLGMTAIFALHRDDLPSQAFRRPAEFIAKLPCSPALKRVLKRAVEEEPSKRFNSCNAFCSALREVPPTVEAR